MQNYNYLREIQMRSKNILYRMNFNYLKELDLGGLTVRLFGNKGTTTKKPDTKVGYKINTTQPFPQYQSYC